MTYKCQYFTWIVSISNYDHKSETQNTEPEIRPDGSRQTRPQPWVDKYGSSYDPPGVGGSGYSMCLKVNQPVCVVHTRTSGGFPAPVGNTSCRCTWNSPLLLIVQKYSNLIYAVCILIYVSISRHIYTQCIQTGCNRSLPSIRGAPVNEDGVNSEIHSKALT